MDPQNSSLDCILCRDLEVLSQQSFQSSSQVLVATCNHLSRLPVLLLGFRRDRVSLVVTVFFSSVYSFCRNRVSSTVTDLSLAP